MTNLNLDSVKIIIPLIRKIMPAIIANDIIGCQPSSPLLFSFVMFNPPVTEEQITDLPEPPRKIK